MLSSVKETPSSGCDLAASDWIIRGSRVITTEKLTKLFQPLFIARHVFLCFSMVNETVVVPQVAIYSHGKSILSYIVLSSFNRCSAVRKQQTVYSSIILHAN